MSPRRAVIQNHRGVVGEESRKRSLKKRIDIDLDLALLAGGDKSGAQKIKRSRRDQKKIRKVGREKIENEPNKSVTKNLKPYSYNKVKK